LIAAAVATFVATMAHVAGGAGVPPLLNVALALVLAAPVCVLLAGRRLSWLRLGIAVTVSQFLFHALLTVPLTSAGTVVGGHHGSSLPAATPSQLASESADHGAADPAMWCAHAVAIALTVALIGRGELAVAVLARALGLSEVIALRTFAPAAVAALLPVAVPAASGAVRRGFVRVLRRRGPPAMLLSS
jgi:hypothetical protein